VPITPALTDTWEDLNEDASFGPEDRFIDNNGNGRFDAFWLAGFGTARAAQDIHDDLWARSMVVDDGNTRIALVSLDVIGLFHDDVIDVRAGIPAETGVDYTTIVSTHNHEGPDLMGLWGPSRFSSGVNPEYLTFVKDQVIASVVRAVEHLQPAYLKLAEDLTGAETLVNDTRLPRVLDAGLRVVQAINPESLQTIGTLVSWANHPETVWSKNLSITSDFPHYLREAIEKGIYRNGELEAEGVGGTTLYVNGAIGGLMTTDDVFSVKEPFGDESFVVPSFAKAKALGEQVALRVLHALSKGDCRQIEKASIRLRAKTIRLPMDNNLFKLGVLLGVLDRGVSGWFKMRSEIAAWTVDELSFLSVPGEIYPEIVQGGIEAPLGQDFPLDPIEIPPLRALMPGRTKILLGLGNDEIGYIIPKSEWDEAEPYLYGADESPYGEINSLGPETGPILHREIRQLLEEL
jgi:hypothetical protein